MDETLEFMWNTKMLTIWLDVYLFGGIITIKLNQNNAVEWTRKWQIEVFIMVIYSGVWSGLMENQVIFQNMVLIHSTTKLWIAFDSHP